MIMLVIPTQEEENYSCPSFPNNTNSCNTTNPDGDMFMDYIIKIDNFKLLFIKQ